MYPGHDMQPINYIRSLMATDGKTKAVGMEDYILKVRISAFLSIF